MLLRHGARNVNELSGTQEEEEEEEENQSDGKHGAQYILPLLLLLTLKCVSRPAQTKKRENKTHTHTYQPTYWEKKGILKKNKK